MINWLNIYKHVLPNARAWRITVEKNLRKFFEGLGGWPANVKLYYDQIFQDIDPQKTRQVGSWEQQFALPSIESTATLQERRDRLDATWKALGGQDPRYIQDTLQGAGFEVHVHEFWEPIPGRPNGGSINGDVSPTVRNPFDYLNDGTNPSSLVMQDGALIAQDGDPEAQDGATIEPQGYPLVNKISEVEFDYVSDGAPAMQDGDPQAQDGGLQNDGITFTRKQYIIPNDPTKFPYFLYIGGQTFPDQATVPENRRDEFEDLCLKICPTEQWLGILVTYS